MATLGETFRETRVRKNVSLSEAAAATRVKVQTLEALEKDDFSHIPAPVYAKGFVRMYAEYLELDPKKCVEEYVVQAGAAAGAKPVIPREIAAAQIAAVDEPKKSSAPAPAPAPAAEPAGDVQPARAQARHVTPEPPHEAGATAIGRFVGAVAAEPLKALAAGLGIAVIVAFLVSGVSRCVSHPGHGPGRRGAAAAADPRAVPFTPPDTYLDVEP